MEGMQVTTAEIEATWLQWPAAYLPFISSTPQQAVLCQAIPVPGSCKFQGFL